MSTLAFIPARGGSSILYKNLKDLGGKPLIQHSIDRLEECTRVDHVVCSTDSMKIATYAERDGRVQVAMRPPTYDPETWSVADVLLNYLQDDAVNHEDLIAFVQPTSPFFSALDLDTLINVMENEPTWASAQTICKIQHNDHWINQRIWHDMSVEFKDWEARKTQYNKQKKSQSWKFGNLIVVRRKNFLITKNFFEYPSYGMEVSRWSALDIDMREDFIQAEALISAGVIKA